MIIDAEFHEVEVVTRAIDSLKEFGLGGDEIEIYSDRPLEFEPGVLDRPSRMSLIAVVAGLGAGAAVTAFMGFAMHSYPLVTGGMPLGPGWSTGVVTFEVGMAGAILATAATFVWESGLLRGANRLPAPPTVTGHEIIVRYRCAAEAAGPVANSLRQSGASRIDEIEEAK